MKRCLIPARVGIFSFIVSMIKALFAICTLTWRVNKHISRQIKVTNRRNESTVIITELFHFDYQLTVKII